MRAARGKRGVVRIRIYGIKGFSGFSPNARLPKPAFTPNRLSGISGYSEGRGWRTKILKIPPIL